MKNVAGIRMFICRIRVTDVHSGKSRYGRRRFQPCNGDPNGRCYADGMENGLSHTSAERIDRNQQKKLDFSDFVRVATGASRLCYYRALQMGNASKIVPIDKMSVVLTLLLAFVFLHEECTLKSLAGCILLGAGTLVMVL